MCNSCSLVSGVVPLVVLVLYPKMRKRSGRLAGKGAVGSARAAVLNALAALRPVELRPLLELLLLPLSAAFATPSEATADTAAAAGSAGVTLEVGTHLEREVLRELEAMDSCRLLPVPWWSPALVTQSLEWWLATVGEARLSQQPLRRRLGFLNTFEDLLQHLGHQLLPLLPPLLAITLQLLSAATAPVREQQQDAAAAAVDGSDGSSNSNDAYMNGEKQSAAVGVKNSAVGAEPVVDHKEGSREIRSSCLKLLAQVFTRFPAAVDLNPLWPLFFHSVDPLMERLQQEAVAAVAPPLLQCVVAVAAAPGLARVLGDLPSKQEIVVDSGGEEADQGLGGVQHMDVDQGLGGEDKGVEVLEGWGEDGEAAWAAGGAGGKLLSSCVKMLGTKGCSEGTRGAVLQLVESLLQLRSKVLLKRVLLPRSGLLLQTLRVAVAEVLAGATGGRQGGGRPGSAKGKVSNGKGGGGIVAVGMEGGGQWGREGCMGIWRGRGRGAGMLEFFYGQGRMEGVLRGCVEAYKITPSSSYTHS